MSVRPTASGVSLDDLIALNDEIAALARAGMPLERGLLGVGGDLPGRLGAITRDLGRRMADGQSLVEALEARDSSIPATYRAVVQAGVRSGRLSEALEGLAGFARSYVELRRAIGLSLLYPTLVLLVGYGLFVLFVVDLIPRLAESFEAMRVPVGPWLSGMARWGDSVLIWGPVLPALVAVGAVSWWRTGRASAFRPGKAGPVFRWVPGVASILDGATSAQFADWLALLVEHGVPWSESVRLAAEATGDARLVASATAISAASDRGEPLAESLKGARAIPPLLAWLMGEGRGQDALATMLRHAATSYRRRAMRRASALRVALPSVLLVGIGATATFLYTMTLFAPWTALLRGMTQIR